MFHVRAFTIFVGCVVFGVGCATTHIDGDGNATTNQTNQFTLNVYGSQPPPSTAPSSQGVRAAFVWNGFNFTVQCVIQNGQLAGQSIWLGARQQGYIWLPNYAIYVQGYAPNGTPLGPQTF